MVHKFLASEIAEKVPILRKNCNDELNGQQQARSAVLLVGCRFETELLALVFDLYESSGHSV